MARLPWPPQFVDGLLYIGGSLHGDGFTGYMIGHKIHGWTPGYYPLAWLIKFPISLQLLTLAGLIALITRMLRRQATSADFFIWGMAVLFLGLGILSSFHIGFRHVLPALPFLILGGGFVVDRLCASRARILVYLGLTWLGVSSAVVYPNGLSYFNEWIGGPKNGWKYLADSNIDWGHNYPELAEYLKRNGLRNPRTYLFSFDNPWHYLDEGSLSPQPLPEAGKSPHRLEPPKGLYAVSVNLLTGLLMPAGYEDYLADFRHCTPIARAGYSIFIYVVE